MAPTPTELDPIAITLKVTGVLESLGIPYFVSGSFASSYYGMLRTTQDADIVAKLDVESAASLSAALQDDFFIDDQMVVGAIRRHSSFNILHKGTMFKVDIFIPRQDEFTQQKFARSQPAAISPDTQETAQIASVEDTILSKLEWYQQGGQVSERQWRDILGLLDVQKTTLDMQYLKTTAAQLKLSGLLSQALGEL